MKKILHGFLLSVFLLSLPVMAGAAVPTARISTYADGQSVCSYSASTTSASLALNATTTGVPTSVEYDYRLKGNTAWTVIGSTGTALVMPWDVSGLTNGGIYEVRAVASNADGADPSPGFIWLKVNQNPQPGVVVTASTSSTFGGKLYVGAGTLNVTSVYTNVLGQARKMDTTVTPAITLTPKGKAAVTGSSNTWTTTTVSSDTVRQTFTIADTTGDGEATVSVLSAKDVNNFTQDGFSTSAVVIDTQKPSVSSVQVDEDGDGVFTDNTGYIRKGQTPRFYVTFSESIFDVSYASYTPTGKTPIALGAITWVNAAQTVGYFTAPAAISATTGDGLAGLVIGAFRDMALNSQTYTATNLVTIDGTVPAPPVVTSPAGNTAVDEGTVLNIKMQNPTDTDIDYASLTLDGGATFYYDYTAPYQFPTFVTGGPIAATVTFTDKAGNTSAGTTVNLTVNPQVDKIVPKAQVTTITINTWPTLISLTAKVDDLETNIKKIEFQYSTDNSTWVSIGTDAKNDDGFLVNWNVTTLSTGTYYLRAIATDNNGNTDSAPAVTAVRISREAAAIDVTNTSAKVDPIYYIQGSIDATAHTITAHINSSGQPSLSIRLDNIATGKTDWLLPEQITVTGSGTSWDATVTNDAITSGIYASIAVFAANSDGAMIFRSCNVGVIPIDNSKNNTLPPPDEFGLVYTINATSLQQNTNLIVKTVPTPVTTQTNIFAVGPTYDLSLADGETSFSPITIDIYYPTTANTGGMYPNSSVLQSKFTICYWDEANQKWTRDKNLVHTAANTVRARTSTRHFSKFSIVGDFANPVAADISVNNDVLTAKVTDEGSGINAATSYVRINGVNYFATSFDQDTNLIVFKAPLRDAGNYHYMLRVIDQVGNYTDYSGVLTYTNKDELTNAHNFPNPFDPDREDTTIRFMISEDSVVTVRIFDFNGNLVTILQRNDAQAYGLVDYKWGGTNDNGKKVANGTYFAEILASGSENGNTTGRTLRKVIKIAVVRRGEE